MTVSGAYGRDYKSRKEIQEDWNANKDFIIRSFIDGSGYVNKEQVPGVEVWGRYKKDRELVRLQ